MTAGLYCTARFCWEFMRYYDDEMRHVFLGLTVWQGVCILVVAASIVSIVLLYRSQPGEPLTSLEQHIKSGRTSRKTAKRKK